MCFLERFLMFGGGPTAIILVSIPILLIVAEWRDRRRKFTQTPPSDLTSAKESGPEKNQTDAINGEHR